MRLRARTKTQAQARPSPLSLPSGPTYTLFFQLNNNRNCVVLGSSPALSLFHVWWILLREDVFSPFICFCVHSCLSGIIKIKWTVEPRWLESFLRKKYFHRCQFPCRFHLFIGHFLCKQVSISMKRRRSLRRLLPEMLSCLWQRSRGFQRLSVVTFQPRLIGRAEVGILKDGEI